MFLESIAVCENITILDDTAVERDRGPGRERFMVVLESTDPNIRIVGTGTTVISIRDNDSM